VGKEAQPILYVCRDKKEVPRCISRCKSEKQDTEEAGNNKQNTQKQDKGTARIVEEVQGICETP
jgi:hypothetical protein